MSYGGAFMPKGPALPVAVGTSAGSVITYDMTREGARTVAWRFSNQTTGNVTVNYADAAGSPAAPTAPAVPVAGTPYPGFTIPPGIVEVWTLPAFLAIQVIGVAAGVLEVIPGEGY